MLRRCLINGARLRRLRKVVARIFAAFSRAFCELRARRDRLRACSLPRQGDQAPTIRGAASHEASPVHRSVLIVLAVAALSAWIASAERAPGVAAAPTAHGSPEDWIRTADGWERRAALNPGPRVLPVSIHPGVLAGFQVVASLLALLVFPGRAVPARAPAPASATQRRMSRHQSAELSASR